MKSARRLFLEVERNMRKELTTKELIARSLVKLSETKSIDKITIQEIVANCGLTKTTFYNHFQDKYDLIVWAYAEPVRSIAGRTGGGGYTLGSAIYDILRYFDDNRKFILNALKNTSGQNYFLHYVARVHFTILRDFVAAQNGFAKVPRRLEALLKLYAYGSVQMVCEWLLDGTPIPAEEFASFLEAGVPEEAKPYVYGKQEPES